MRPGKSRPRRGSTLRRGALRPDPRIQAILAGRDAALAKDPDPLAPFRVALEGGMWRQA